MADAIGAQAVFVTHHGKDAHVLISLDDYRRLDGDAASDIAAASDLRQASLAGLVDSFRDGVILVDRQRRIVALNPAASDMLEIPAARLIGEEVTTALPGLKDSLIAHHILRLLDYRERFSGDVPGIFRPRQWLHVDLVPLPVGGAIVLRDVSDAMEEFAAGDMRQAMLDAIEIDGGIGHARISVRETVEAANAVLTGLLGVDLAAIRRVRFSALLAVGQRAAFVEALESVFRSGPPARVASQMVTRDGSVVDVTLSIVEVRGPYAERRRGHSRDSARRALERASITLRYRPRTADTRAGQAGMLGAIIGEEGCKRQLSVYVKGERSI